MATKLCFFNVNNLFLRYRFGRTYPGDVSGASMSADPDWGFIPANAGHFYQAYKPEQTEISAFALGQDNLPDILCLCEIESLHALRLFNDMFLGRHYPYSLLVDSYDFRQIDVGILSTREIINIRSHVDDLDSLGRRIFSRDCLEVTLALNRSASQRLTLFINHFKSKFVDTRGKTDAQIAAESERSNQKRRLQADTVTAIVRKRYPGALFGKNRFIVLGDFNDTPGSPFMKSIVQDLGLYNVIEELPAEERWTHWWKSKNRTGQIDFMLLSPSLTNSIQQNNIKPRIERRAVGFQGFYASGNLRPLTTRIFQTDDDLNPVRVPFDFQRFESVMETGQHASDHCPIFLEIP